MAVFGAIGTADVLHGAMFMFLFGLGTVPLMTTAIFIGKLFTPKRKKQIQRLIPVMVIIIGILFIVRGLGLGIPYLSPTEINDVVSGQMNCH